MKDVHPYLHTFVHERRAVDVEAHICWGHRDEESQNKAFLDGTSDFKWPDSKHNKLPSEAVDFFIYIPGNPTKGWPTARLTNLLQKAAQLAGLRWGGDWNMNGISEPREKDRGHVELVAH